MYFKWIFILFLFTWQNFFYLLLSIFWLFLFVACSSIDRDLLFKTVIFFSVNHCLIKKKRSNSCLVSFTSAVLKMYWTVIFVYCHTRNICTWEWRLRPEHRVSHLPSTPGGRIHTSGLWSTGTEAYPLRHTPPPRVHPITCPYHIKVPGAGGGSPGCL